MAQACQLSLDLQAAFRAQGMTQQEVVEVGAELARRTRTLTVNQYVGYFSAKEDFIVKFWEGNAAWAHSGSLLAYMRNALLALSKAADKVRNSEDSLLDMTLDNPIDPKTNRSLTQAWVQEYGFNLHPTQEATVQLLSSMWRKLQLRQTQADVVRGLHTLESTGGIEPGKRAWAIGDLRLVDENDAKGKEVLYHVKASPFLYLCALETMMRTLAKAGSYPVTDPEDNRTLEEVRVRPQRLMIERELIEDHLANCRSFVLEWTTKPRPPHNGAITTQLSRIDLRLREKWTKLYRENKPEGRTFSKCIKECIPTADSLWSADLSKEMGPGKGNGKGGDNDSPSPRTPPRRDKKGGERSATREPTRAPKGGGKDGKTGTKTIVPGTPAKVKNGKMAKTANKRDTKSFCRYYQDGKCDKADACRFVHVCNVMVAHNKVCEGKHPASEHTGHTV